MTIQLKASEQYFHVVLVVLTFQSVDETLVLSCGTVYYAVQGSSNFLSL